MRFRAFCIGLGACALCSPAAAVTDIQFWHSMSGSQGETVAELIQEFNTSQRDWRVVPVFKGPPAESLAAATAAAGTAAAPHILEAESSAAATLLAARNAVKPLHLLMTETGEKLDAKMFLPAIGAHYSDARGKMLALPFNAVTAVFYYNRDAFRKAGLDPDAPPKTWREVQEAALKVRASDAAPCAYTTARPSWVLLENTSAWHNEPFATRSNGHAGPDAKLVFNGLLLVRHIGLLSSWVKSELFTYAGRRDEAEAKFASGECAMMTGSSAAYARIAKGAKFEFSVAPLPYYDDFKGAPYAAAVGGSSLWALAGKKRAEYRGVAKFLRFVSQPEVQAEWLQKTGYPPVTTAGYQLCRTRGCYQSRPGAETAVKELSQAGGAHARGPRIAHLAQIRAVIDEELESVWAQKKTPKEALDSAVERGNELLRRFGPARRR